MSDKGFERSDKMSVDYIRNARGMSEFILSRSYRGPGDTVEAAMHRAERSFGAPATWMHRLRYRNIKDMPVSAYGAILRAYTLAKETSQKAYEAEREQAHARNSKLIGLADLAVGADGQRAETTVPPLLVTHDEATTTPE
ncbi:hypothetical protein HNQ68_003371 [Pseudochrobactrum saccharolyticum]|uniref:Uncharacterized protein n=1 Tax=Pseudochrobactrum saccharolyticum TaxID=354352 RepID=A0A7W8ALY0_9HYPH|nr:hypothetical protein [Pseudochrobactrum saccharolyticum]KAB0539849.1 hypothetical protein F7P81_00030 [Pseudochrobactrum saccharolyticum]MBB5092808.1 hypothetical protein [Pseudochrobactrum saccharolyticum]